MMRTFDETDKMVPSWIKATMKTLKLYVVLSNTESLTYVCFSRGKELYFFLVKLQKVSNTDSE